MNLKSTAAWRQIGDKRIYARSMWEANYGRYLEWLKERGDIKEWHHEPNTFWFKDIKRGTNSYKPDYLVINNDDSEHWVEVKGYYDKKSLTKIKRMGIYFPKEKLILVDQKWFANNNHKCAIIIPSWEKG